ncbi:MAG: beta-galactosidase, partial [Lachnospiraceae bacterium]|nr:beta-galactosidase [Lachnospiraceae bacterium]
PYTGLALVDDPAVVVVQINNEESAINGTMGTDGREDMQPYRDEVQRKFNHFLLMKYGSREQLKKAWTNDGICALGDEEDPEKGTVLGVEGDAYQPVNDPAAEWDSAVNPARYADFMEFGIWINRNFYQMMKDYLRSLGVKAPIVTSNLLTGAADIYGHIDGDVIENNSYFNHPLLPVQDNTYQVLGPKEYVSVNPLTMQRGGKPKTTSLLSLASEAILKGKPFILSEWNEYGLHPFHSTSLVHTVAYACLNDWDGLILYNHHTSEHWNDQPADEILSIFDVYNDPAVVCQWGFMASIFLKGLVSAAKHRVDVVYTQNDLRTLPIAHAMPSTFFPYVTAMRNVFLDGGDSYQGDADVAVNAGFLNGADLSDAQHSVYYAWSSYRDAARRYKEEYRMTRAAKGTRKLHQGVHLGEQVLVFDEIAQIAQNGDYSVFAKIMDQAMKEWGILQEDTGLVEGKFISDTKEIIFDPARLQYMIHTPYCAYFSGVPDDKVVLSDRIMLEVKNERITLALIPVEGDLLADAKEYTFAAMGSTGMDKTVYQPGTERMGRIFTRVVTRGKLYAETLEGALYVKAKEAELRILSPVGDVLAKMEGCRTGKGICFALDGEIPGIQYHLIIKS